MSHSSRTSLDEAAGFVPNRMDIIEYTEKVLVLGAAPC